MVALMLLDTWGVCESLGSKEARFGLRCDFI